jgi:hypothetical protein
VSFQSTLIGKLTGNAGLHTLLADRIWPGKWPQNPQLPYIVLFELTTKSHQAFGNTVVVRKPVFRFIINSESYSNAEAVGAALVAALVASGYAVGIEDENTDTNVTSGVHRRDIDVGISHV